MDTITLDAKLRQPGKGPARAARRAKDVPCVLYGHDQAPVSFQVEERRLDSLIYTTAFHRVTVKVDSDSYDCILKHIDFHPTSDRPMHADFLILRKGEALTLSVPLRAVGMSAGQRDGGRVYEPMHEIEITCLPKDIPDFIEMDVEPIEIGDSIHVSDLSSPGVEFVAPSDTVVFSVMAARLEIEEEEEEILEGLEPGEEGEEGAEEEGEQE